MKKLLSLFLSLMMLFGCANVSDEGTVMQNPIRFYTEYQGDGWVYYGLYEEDTKLMHFTGVYMRHYHLPGYYMYVYNRGKLVDKTPSSIAHLGVGETTRGDMEILREFLDKEFIYPVSMDDLELETLDTEVVESIVNKAYEQPAVGTCWEIRPDTMFSQRNLDDDRVLSVGHIMTDVLMVVFIDILDGDTYLRDKVDLSDDEKKLVEEFERIEKEIVEKQDFLVIEDSDDPVMHQLYSILRELDIKSVKKH